MALCQYSVRRRSKGITSLCGKAALWSLNLDDQAKQLVIRGETYCKVHADQLARRIIADRHRAYTRHTYFHNQAPQVDCPFFISDQKTRLVRAHEAELMRETQARSTRRSKPWSEMNPFEQMLMIIGISLLLAASAGVVLVILSLIVNVVVCTSNGRPAGCL
jgi:hypothetical protein